jgi:2-dehydro-3-deoxyphosphooctonate aldolase (KDO 8-P synthase)
MCYATAMQLLGHDIGDGAPLFVIAGPCVIESEAMALRTAEALAGIADRLGLLLIYKSSFDKANRTSVTSYRGPGIDEGLRILAKVKAETGLPVLTDVHEEWQAAAVAEVADVLQTPAFLARQTDFIQAVARTGRPVNIKKAQFMAPADMEHVAAKARAVSTDHDKIMLCERGTSFGYGNLVVDMRGLAIMRRFAPVVFDATHSVQLPSVLGGKSGGDRAMVPVLARAAAGAGIDGLFLETHPDPDQALSDGPNSVRLDQVEALLDQVSAIHTCAYRWQL